MDRLDKLEIRARGLRETLDDFVSEISSDHPFWRARGPNPPSRSRLDDETLTMIRYERDLTRLHEQLGRPTWKPELRDRPSGQGRLTDIKVNSIPRDHVHVIDETALRDSQRVLTERGLPVIDKAHLCGPADEPVMDKLVVHARWHPHLDEVHLKLHPWPAEVLDDWVREMFANSLLPGVLAFQVDVRLNPQNYKKFHHELQVWWRETWFETSPASLPSLEEMI